MASWMNAPPRLPCRWSDGLAKPVVGPGEANQALRGPGERVGGRLVPGEDEREQLVSTLLVVQRLAILGRRLEQQRQMSRRSPRSAAPRRSAITW